MNCSYCRGKIPNHTVTCPHCGAPVTEKTPGEKGAEWMDAVRDTVKSVFNGVTGSSSSEKNPSVSDKNKYIAGILGIVFGVWGVHNFYLGRIGRGICQFLLCWTGISWVWGAIEGILCLFGNYKDGKGLPLA